MADDTYPGIELRVRTEHGLIIHARSDTIHFELRQMFLENGFTGDEWYPLGGTVLRAALVEVRAVDVPALPSAPDYPHELADIDGQAAELEFCSNCPSINACRLVGRCLISGELERTARLAAAAAGHTPAPPPPPDEESGAGAGPASEPSPGPVRARLGSYIARTARRARFRSGR